MDTRKPLGIVLIAIYGVLSGLYALSIGSVTILFSVVPALSGWAYLLTTCLTVFAVLILASVYGLWSIQSWGWRLTFWLYVAAIPLSVVLIFPVLPLTQFTIANMVFQIFMIGIDAAIILYLYRIDISFRYGVFRSNTPGR